MLNDAVRVKRLLVTLAGASVLTLTGCGVQGLQWHPGIAATVGDQTITDQRVDDLTTGYCTSGAVQSAQAAGPLRARVLAALVTKDASEQLADAYDVKPGSTYNQAVSQAQSAVGSLSKSKAAAVVELQSVGPYIQSVIGQIGAIELKRQGTSGGTSDQATAAGIKVLSAWIRDHDVDISPAYDVTVDSKGQLNYAGDDTSYAVSSDAKAGTAQLSASQPDADYVAGLPTSQVCGSGSALGG